MDAGKWTTAKQLSEMTGPELKDFYDGMSVPEQRAFNQRLLDAAQAESWAAWWKSGPLYGLGAIVITTLSIFLPFWILVTHLDALPLLFRSFALSASIVAALAAGIRLVAHPNLKKLDGFGKMLGFSAAMLAAFAAGVLFFGDASKALKHDDSPSSPPTSFVSPPTNQGRFGSGS